MVSVVACLDAAGMKRKKSVCPTLYNPGSYFVPPLLCGRPCVRVSGVSDEEALKDVHLKDQADATLNTAEAFQKRNKLKRHPGIVDGLSMWWRIMLKTSGGASSATTISYTAYNTYYHLIYCRSNAWKKFATVPIADFHRPSTVPPLTLYKCSYISIHIQQHFPKR